MEAYLDKCFYGQEAKSDIFPFLFGALFGALHTKMHDRDPSNPRLGAGKSAACPQGFHPASAGALVMVMHLL